MRVDRAAKRNSSNRLREGLLLALVLTVAIRGILQEIVPNLAPKALVIIRMISQDPAVVVMVEEVGVMEDGGAVEAAAIKRRWMADLQLQYLRLHLQHLPPAPPTSPCRFGQLM